MQSETSASKTTEQKTTEKPADRKSNVTARSSKRASHRCMSIEPPIIKLHLSSFKLKMRFRTYWGSHMEWLLDYSRQQLGVAFDQPQDQSTANFDFLGMVGHSWNDCIFSIHLHLNTCIHFVQASIGRNCLTCVNVLLIYLRRFEGTELGAFLSGEHQHNRHGPPF